MSKNIHDFDNEDLDLADFDDVDITTMSRVSDSPKHKNSKTKSKRSRVSDSPRKKNSKTISKKARVSHSPRTPEDLYAIDRSDELPMTTKFKPIVSDTCKIILLNIKNKLHKRENIGETQLQKNNMSDEMFDEMTAEFLTKIKKYVKLTDKESNVLVSELLTCGRKKEYFQEYLKEYIKKNNHTIDYDAEDPYQTIIDEHMTMSVPNFMKFLSENKKGGKTRKQRKH
jgi:hypothetical protein